MSQHSNENDPLVWWIARPENANKIWYALVTVCVGLIVLDFGYHGFVHDKHGYFVFETAIAFHGIYGFGAFVFVVLLGKELRKLIMRSEDYYAVDSTVPTGSNDHAHEEHNHDHDHTQGDHSIDIEKGKGEHHA